MRTDADVVHGVTLPGAQLSIEGVPVAVSSNGRFQVEVPLTAGNNTIRVVSTDSQSATIGVTVNVTSLALPPQPFVVVITEPKDQSIVSEQAIPISDRTGPEAIITVNEVSVTVDELDFFFTQISLDTGPNIIDLVAANGDGRVLSAVLVVIYRP